MLVKIGKGVRETIRESIGRWEREITRSRRRGGKGGEGGGRTSRTSRRWRRRNKWRKGIITGQFLTLAVPYLED